jgi:hypothetical protein
MNKYIHIKNWTGESTLGLDEGDGEETRGACVCESECERETTVPARHQG